MPLVQPVGGRVDGLPPVPETAPTAIGVISAAVAVLERQVEIRADEAPMPKRRPSGVRAKRPRPRSRAATRRSSPYFLNASASRKLPTNRKMTGSAYGARTALVGATPRITHSAEARSAVAGSGIASVTQ